MKTLKTNVCIIGAGAGGFGCLYRLLKNGINAVIVDENPGFGGTSVFGGVNCWEPGVSLDGVHQEIAAALLQCDHAAMVAKTVPNCRLLDGTDEHSFEKYPWGLSVKAEDPYVSTLKRCKLFHGGKPEEFRRFQFEDTAMSLVMDHLTDHDGCQKLFGYKLLFANADNGIVRYVIVGNGSEFIKIHADYFVDATGSIVLARMVDCEAAVGSEPYSQYNEPSAPDKKDMCLNGVTYVFRVAKKAAVKDGYDFDTECRESDIISCFNMYPNGDINVNMLPTMSGEAYLKDPFPDKTGFETVKNYWNCLQRKKGMSQYTITKIFKAGIREDYRIVGKYVLTENDMIQGVFNQNQVSGIIAVADHAMDIHGKGGRCKELDVPYGIPVDCSMTKEYENLFVACRGASFSHIAASSARLTRTMISFGEGVGEYLSEMLLNGFYRNIVQGARFSEFVKDLRMLHPETAGT